MKDQDHDSKRLESKICVKDQDHDSKRLESICVSPLFHSTGISAKKTAFCVKKQSESRRSMDPVVRLMMLWEGDDSCPRNSIPKMP